MQLEVLASENSPLRARAKHTIKSAAAKPRTLDPTLGEELRYITKGVTEGTISHHLPHDISRPTGCSVVVVVVHFAISSLAGANLRSGKRVAGATGVA